jgi:protein-L-isoaspartate(D-aspartate) O-methyltransferase
MTQARINLDDSKQRMRRVDLVERALRQRGIRDERVLEAMAAVPRHLFVSPEQAEQAYEDRPLPIRGGQTISQPYMVAWMLQVLQLRGSERVLDVGTGSGYQAALLAALAQQVISVEVSPDLAQSAAQALALLGVTNVDVVIGDGSLGWHEAAPYDAIIVGAGAPRLPTPLVDQLAVGGTLVIPVGERHAQRLMRVRKRDEQVTHEALGECSFVPLVGRHGWPERWK